MKSVFYAGAPSQCGGADTEALSMVIMFRKYDIDVNIVPMDGITEEARNYLISIGCKIHKYTSSIFHNQITISLCNGNLLHRLPEIQENGKPAMLIWGNCMVFTFEKEIIAHQNKWIDCHLFVSPYQKSILKPLLEKHNPVQELEGYKPYFDPTNKLQNFEFTYNKPDRWFGVGRISRDDGAKFAYDTWNMFYKICTKQHKKVFILGYGPNAQKKCGNPPGELDWQGYGEGSVNPRDFYKILHAMPHCVGESKESYCRVVIEAMACGVPVIVENAYNFKNMIEDGITGFLCNSSDEMSYRASQLSFDEELRKRIIISANAYLHNEIANAEKCWLPWKKILSV